MNAELPDDLRALDDELKRAMQVFAPPADLDAKIVSHVSRRSRLSLVPTSRTAKGAAAVVAASLLAGVGYVADRQINGGRSWTTHDLERLVAFDDRHGEVDGREDEDFKACTQDSELAEDTVQGDLTAGWGEGRGASGDRENGQGGQARWNFFATPAEDRSDSAESFMLRMPLGASGPGQGEAIVVSRRPHDGTQGVDVGGEGDLLGTDERVINGTSPLGLALNKSGVSTLTASGATSYQGGTEVSSGESVVDRKNHREGEDGRKSTGDTESDVTRQIAESTYRPAEERDSEVNTAHDSVTVDRVAGISGKFAKGEAHGNGLSEKPQPQDGLQGAVTFALADAPIGGGGGGGNGGGQERSAPPAAQPVAIRQKVIRNGTVEFEVESFDTALLTVSKLVLENGGFVAATDSSKLPNGKTRGAVTLRVPPERLDTLVLMLRGIGDLRSQKIAAQDVSKQYTDIESQLKAARAMEERLLEMIRKGNGAIKDLLAAEKELGGWREKIEKLEGEIRYYDNLIGLSTLTVVMEERDIKASAASIETETVSAGVETDDVEKARSDLLTTIDEAKGRVITSELKKLDAGQFAATIVAEVAPDRSGPVVDRLKQLGKVARLDVDRKQTTVDGTAPPVPGAKVEQRPTRLTISLYNLANVAPRLTTTVTLASGDVETGYKQVMALVEKAGGRVVASQLQRPQADQVVASLQVEVPSAQAAASQDAMTALGEVMSLQLSENPDTANVTTAKQGFSLRIVSAASVAARETVTLQLASPDVAKAHDGLAMVATKVAARVVQSNVNEDGGDNVTAVLQIDLPRAALAEWDQAQRDAGDVLARSVVRSTDTQNTIDSKVRVHLTFFPADRLPPRQVTTAAVRVRSSESQQQAFLAQAQQLGGRVIDQTLDRDADGRSRARVVFDVPHDKAVTIFDALRAAGEIKSMNTGTNAQAPQGPLARTRFDLQLNEVEALVGAESGVWSSLKAGLATSLKGLGYSLRLLVVATCLVAPWAAVIWGGWKLVRRKATRTMPARAAGVDDGLA